uniref:Uncharacterized protein n=1 Tax=Trichogramma kaykai TaxID=54128 RepID=A0ABD2VYQ0_9HYME
MPDFPPPLSNPCIPFKLTAERAVRPAPATALPACPWSKPSPSLPDLTTEVASLTPTVSTTLLTTPSLNELIIFQ